MINDRIVKNFIQFIKDKLDTPFQLPALYDDPFIFEDADPPFSLSLDIDPEKEYIAYQAEKIYKHPEFQRFMQAYNLQIAKHKLQIREAALLDNIQVNHYNLHMPFHKTIVKIKGLSHRDVSLNFINSKEWVLHVYDKNTLLYYFLCSVNNAAT